MPVVETLQNDTVTEPDSLEAACVWLGLKGSYLANSDAALKRVNEIREEACREGVQDSRDPKRKLTMADYVPIKWSSDLEYIARIRAAKASVYVVWGESRLGRTDRCGDRTLYIDDRSQQSVCWDCNFFKIWFGF